MTPLAAACAVIAAAAVQYGMERARSESARRLLAFSDAMLEELEALNLREVDLVDAGCRRRLEELLRSLPFACPASLEPDLSPTEALDLLFDVQRGLLAAKYGGQVPPDQWDDD